LHASADSCCVWHCEGWTRSAAEQGWLLDLVVVLVAETSSTGIVRGRERRTLASIQNVNGSLVALADSICVRFR
jgi:hypothetical protein